MSKQSQELIDSEVVYFIPMLVQYIDTGLEPLHFLFNLRYTLHDLAYLDGSFSLVDGLVGMPIHKEEAFPDDAEMLLLGGLFQFNPSLVFDEKLSQLFQSLITQVLL